MSQNPTMSLAEANRKFFDSIGDAYDSKPWFAKVNQLLTDNLRNRLDWIGIPFVNTGSNSSPEEIRFLDYACGPGLMSRIFGPYVTISRGIDIAPNMVETYNKRAREFNLPPETVNAVLGDLFSNPQNPPQSDPEFTNFDLAAVGMGFHHFEDVVYAAKCLKERLKPGGVLVITDFLDGGDLKADEEGNPIEGTEGNHVSQNHHHGHGHHGHREHHEHGHGGQSQGKPKEAEGDPTLPVRKEMNNSIVVYAFSVEGVKKFFTEAGFVEVDVKVIPERVYMNFAGTHVWRTILLAKGRRPFEEKERSEL
ncbi:S-adenosyl-L-methionine-dependent methyltransferase [Lojkania enalia]|uniref:S-adenosyl-L-methionine-dependent methyltransferase n=1 Tax=Lojkania enalia TaxID=147567 RepID=A0A9P4N3B6_9PLEO|nr:S-adenosyl-L-methionine-dependent methyltransferase [Didymosphaeria enalia]